MKKYLILCILLALAAVTIAQIIPYPVDSAAYEAYKAGLIGRGKIAKQAPPPHSAGSLNPLDYKQQTRTGLLVPLDATFIQALGGNDDSYTAAIALPFTFDFYGSTQTQFYINNNGNISFGNPYSAYSSTGFPIAEYPMLAAFWADVDTRPAASAKVSYKVEATRVTVIWNGVGYYANHTDKLNTFEVIFTNGADPLIGIGNNVAFSYGDMQWTTGDASGGSGGFGGTPATVGLNKGDGINYGLIGRFDHEGTDYYGPGGAPSGISYLDNQLFTFSALQGNNIPPIFTGVPTYPVPLRIGDSTTINLTSVSPLPTNTVNAVVQHDFSSGFTYTVTPGNPCSITIQVTGSAASLGSHLVSITATDSGNPQLSSTASFYINVIMLNEYVLVANPVSASINVIDVATSAVYGPFLSGQLGSSNLLDVVVSPDGSFALVSNFDNNTVYHLNMSNPLNPSVLASYALGFAAEDITLSYNGRYAVIADGGNSTQVAVLDLQSRTTVQNINIYPHHAQGVAINIDGKVLINDCDNSAIYLYSLNLQNGQLMDTGYALPFPQPMNIAFSPSGEYALVASFNSNNTTLFQLNPDNSLTMVQELATGFAQVVAFSPDGSKAAIGTVAGNHTVKLYNVGANNLLSLVASYTLATNGGGGYYGVDGLAINSANSKIFAGCFGNSIFSPVRQITVATGAISTLATGNVAGICLGNLPLKAYFSTRISNLMLSSQVQFKQFSTGTPTSFAWNFGDGSSSTLQNPSHEYLISGIYTVSLTVQRGSYSHSSSQTIEVQFNPVLHLTLAGSPYYFGSDLVVLASQTITIDSGVQLIFAPTAGLIVNGIINATGATFSGSDTQGWKGISIDTVLSPLTLDNCNIWHAIQALKITNTSFTINNLLINKTAVFPEEVGIWIVGASNMVLNNVQVLNYTRGIVFNNTDLRITTSPSLTNVRIRNTSSAIRPLSRGLEVIGAVGLAINTAEIEEFDEGVFWDAQGTGNYRTTPSLTNVRIRNTSSSVRSASYGLKLLNLSSVIVANDSIGGYPTGLEIQNTENLRVTTSASLSNVRIRNTSSSLRTETFGLRLTGSVMALMDSMDVTDYTTGIYYEGTGQPFDRTTPSLSNVRIRNTNSSIREPAKGIVLKNLAAANLQKNIIYPDLNSGEGNAAGTGISLDAVFNASIQQNTIFGLSNGLNLLNSANISFTSNVIWTNGAPLETPITTTGSTVQITNNDISLLGGTYPGDNINIDPQFAEPDSGNFYLKPRSPLRQTGIGALPFDFAALAAVRSYTMHPGWNMMGVPYMTLTGQDTPLAIFGDDLNPFYVAPTYTSIVQMNTNAMPDTLGHIVFSYNGNFNMPTQVRSGVGYWVRNPYTQTTPIDVYGLLDDGPYTLNVPGANSSTNGWYLLANPYDVPISSADGSIDLVGDYYPGVYVYNYANNSYDLLDEAAGISIPAWSAFFVKTRNATDKVLFNYPEDARQTTINDPIAGNNFSPGSTAKPLWQITLNAVCEGNSDALNLGISQAASDSYDPMDVPELPSAPFVLNRGLEFTIANNDWEQSPGHYTRDIRNAETGAWSWPLLLNVENLLVDGRFSGSIRIMPEANSKLPATNRYTLINPATGQSCDLQCESLLLNLDIDTATYDGVTLPWLIPLRVEVSPLNAGVLQDNRDIIFATNYPNPFNPETTISYSLGMDSAVSLEIYNIKGQLVQRLVNEPQVQGTHSVVWNGKDTQGRDVSSGFYFYRLNAGSSSVTRKILLMK